MLCLETNYWWFSTFCSSYDCFSWNRIKIFFVPSSSNNIITLFLLAKFSRLFKQNTWANKSTFLRQLRLHQKIRRYFYVFKVVMMVLQFDDFFTKWKLIFFTLKRHNYAINIVCNIYLRHFYWNINFEATQKTRHLSISCGILL